jgi:cyclohexanone monooxygenase
MSTLYSFSFAPNPDWSRIYGTQPEIQRYLVDVAERFGLNRRIEFGTEALEFRWDEASRRWLVETNRGRYAAEAVIAAAGPLHEPKIPEIAGLDSFEGAVFHSATWDHDYDLSAKRVAVVGTGASAVQFIPEIQPLVGEMTIFQRTAPWIVAKPDAPVPPRVRELFRRLPFTQRLFREAIYYSNELVQIAQRNPWMMQQVQKLALRRMREIIRDPDLRRKVTPDYTMGCKRILPSNRYYPALTRDNVSLVAAGVTEVRPHSVIDAHGDEHEVDTIIFGTGFHATDPPIADRVYGRDGRSLAETWGGSFEAYLGTTIPGFPNAFLTLGPNLGNGHNSALIIVEAQLRYIVDALRTMERERVSSLDVRREVSDAWNEQVQEALGGTVWNAGGCHSWYLNAEGRNVAIYPWTTIDMRRRMRGFDLDDFELTRADGDGTGDAPATAGDGAGETAPPRVPA